MINDTIIAGSGQSPNSTHPGSPPAITAPPPSLLNNKRPGYYQGNDGLPTKRPRISHYKKSEQNSGSSITGENGRTAGSGNSNNSVSVVSGAGSTSANGGNSSNSGGVVDGWDQRQHQRDRRGDYRPERTANSDVLRSSSYSTGKLPCLTPTSDSEEINQTVGHRDGIITSTGSSGNNTASNPATGHNSHSIAHSNSLSGNRHHTGKIGTDTGNSGTDYVTRLMPSVVSDGGSSASSFSGSSNGILADRRDRSDRNDRSRASERDRDSRKKSNGTGGNSYNDLTAPDYTATEDNTVSTSSCALELPESPKSSEYPDYLT